MRRIALALLVLLCLAPALNAQVVPSLYVPLAGNCALYDTLTGSPLAASTTAFLGVRGLCGIPSEANAVAVAVFTSSRLRGELSLFDAGLSVSAARSLLRYGSGADSGFGIVRLCHPVLECSEVDLSLRVTTAAHVTLRAAGYFVPAPE